MKNGIKGFKRVEMGGGLNSGYGWIRRRGIYVGLKRRFDVDPIDLDRVDPSILG
jgi:hypothetical protein